MKKVIWEHAKIMAMCYTYKIGFAFCCFSCNNAHRPQTPF